MSSSTASQPRLSVQTGLCIGALGVVFGDIGTSPLYTMKECLASLPEVDHTAGVLGILSLMFWSMLIVVSLKYITFVMRADNRGEGGIFALLALSNVKGPHKQRGLSYVAIIILAGAALLYGDGVITPAITVLSASESVRDLSPAFAPYVVTLACVILGLLFWFQHKGTKTIGSVFGPVMLVWFVSLGAIGAWHLCQDPGVLKALSPHYGLALLCRHPADTVPLLGAVVLTLTGAEALYADMGHFGHKYIAWAWYGIVWPGLLLNYFGQGAWALRHPADPGNPFYALAPSGALQLYLIIISIVAAIIASQSLISGTYSLTRQAIQLGYFPRLKVTHTNAMQSGQIYVPLINTLLGITCILVVIGFGSSDRLAAAYGIAVTGTMTVTTYAFYRVARLRWHWSWWKAFPLCGVFMIVDLAFFLTNLHKFSDGGWFPLALALLILAVMHTWKLGRNEIQEKVYSGALADLDLSNISKSKSILRVPGSAIFMAATPRGTPLALLHHLKANKCLQQTVVLLTILNEEVPHISAAERLAIEDHGEGVWRAICRYGYMESPDVTAIIAEIQAHGVPIKLNETTFYFNREMIITGGDARMWEWEKNLYAFLSRNARPVKDYYQIMPTQIIEIGLPVQL